MNETYHDWLKQLTATPTAAGREHRVIAWVQRWARRRRNIELSRDRFGNVILKRRGVSDERPVVFEAHLDHPQFVVTGVVDKRTLAVEFRGGVHPAYFVGTPVLLHRDGQSPTRGRVEATDVPESRQDNIKATVRFSVDVTAEAGDIVTWDTGDVRVDKKGIIHTPACDNLASVAASLAALEQLRSDRVKRDVRVLLSRAEEVGFVGAIAAAKHRSIPKKSRVIVLENSRSYAESPVGGGPILRVGDRTYSFDPDLSFRLGKVAESLETNGDFQWQRKLMPGGTCNASAYLAFGYTAACICLPLGNYHNMNEDAGRIEAEYISLRDWDMLVRWLVAVGRRLDDAEHAPKLKSLLARRFAKQRHLLD